MRMKLGTLKRIIREAVNQELSETSSYVPAPRDQWIGPPPGAVGSVEDRAQRQAASDKAVSDFYRPGGGAGLAFVREKIRREWANLHKNMMKQPSAEEKDKFLEKAQLELVNFANANPHNELAAVYTEPDFTLTADMVKKFPYRP